MTTVDELEQRLQRLEDESALRSLLARYSFNADLARSRAYVALYAPDGAIEIDNEHRFEGEENLLLKFITGVTHRTIEGRCQHVTSGPIAFYIDGDDAEAESYSLVLVKEGDIPNAVTGLTMPDIRVFTANFNHWKFRRIDGAWRIVERRLRPIGSPDASEVITRTTS